MKHADEECRRGDCSINHAARAWCLPRSTLQLRVNGKVEGFRHVSGRKPIISSAAEDELTTLLVDLARRGFPLSGKLVRDVAYQYAQENKLAGFSQTKGTAGYDWLNSFMKRHPNLAMRKPEALSAPRASSVNPTVIGKWFNDLEKFMVELKIKDKPANIWNVDETGVQDHFIPKRVLSEKSKDSYQLAAGEKGETTTIVAGFNALGKYTPIMVIFKGKRCKPEWLDNAPSSAMVRMSERGWVTTEIFMEWGRRFISQLPTADGSPHLLLLDGHSSHLYNLEFLRMMRENRVEVWCFPPHSTHVLQLADVSLFRSLKHNWNENGLARGRENGAKKLARAEFFLLYLHQHMKQQQQWRTLSQVFERQVSVP